MKLSPFFVRQPDGTYSPKPISTDWSYPACQPKSHNLVGKGITNSDLDPAVGVLVATVLGAVCWAVIGFIRYGL
jgi:hypothetical protein